MENGTAEHGPHPTLYQQLQMTVERFADREFMVYHEARPTYRTFLANVDRLARSLLASGVKRGDNVALWMGNCPEWMYVWYACASIGACLVPVNTRYRTQEVEYILRQSDSTALIMKDRFLGSVYLPMLASIVPELFERGQGEWCAEKLPELRRVIVIGEEVPAGALGYGQFLALGEAVPDDDYRRARAAVSPQDRVIMVYTSGTTGAPKGAMHNHNILRNMRRVCEWMAITEQDRIFIGALPFFHVFGAFAGATCAIISGACLVTMDAFEPGEWLALWERERCTVIHGVPTMFIMGLDHPDLAHFDLSSARTGMMGGSLCPVEVVRAIQRKMGLRELMVYGMTETTSVTTLSRLDDDPETVATTVGQPIGGWEIKIADPATGEELPPNTQGEIWTRGHHVMMGYYKKPEETAQAIDAEGWFHTGDLATRDERGYLRITGRLKDMYITGGFNVYPAEIENFLFRYPKVKQVYVVGVPDYRLGEVGMAFVELKEGQTATPEEIVAFCKAELAGYKVPRYVKIVKEWPMTPTGKIQKFRLREQGMEELRRNTKMSANDAKVGDPPRYSPEATVTFLGKRLRVLDLSHEISPSIPIYPGLQKVAFWTHLTHAESRLRLPADAEFNGYAVTGMAFCDHSSTHMDAVSHFNDQRPDLSIDTVAFQTMITPAVWVDLSFVPPRTHITLRDVRKALDSAGVAAIPAGGTFLYWTGAEKNWGDPLKCVTEYPGLDAEASEWILDQGVVNVCTDAISTDNPADLYYPNHLIHGRRLVVHSENVANITKIPRHEGFYLMMLPLRLQGVTGSPVRALALWEDQVCP